MKTLKEPIRNCFWIEVIDNLFEGMQAIFPAFKQAWPTQELFDRAKREWIKAFVDADLHSVERIGLGLKKFRKSLTPFVPSPGQFIAMCSLSAEDLNLPSCEVAFKEACLNSSPYISNVVWSHAAVHHARMLTGSHELRTLPAGVVFKIFARNYEITIQKILNGEVLPEVPKGIENLTSVNPDKSTYESAMKQIKQSLGMKDATE